MKKTDTERKPILLVDFDGVIHSYTSGWQGAHVAEDPPVPGAPWFLEQAIKHFHVNIYSSRSDQPGGRAAMANYCQRNFGPPIADQLYFPLTKPAAFLTIDDRCICFEGDFPDPKELLRFKPWNKRISMDEV